MVRAIPDYANLDLSGEARAAAARMEARAREPASEEMFRSLVAPLVGPHTRAVLELGCGTAALSRRIARAAPHAEILATDKSLGMLEVARSLCAQEGASAIRFGAWDVLDEDAFPDRDARYDLIVSSVMILYLQEPEAEDLVRRLARRLRPGGTLAFVEQDHMSDALEDASGLAIRIMEKERRTLRRTQGLGLRAALRRAGLSVLPRRSFLWTDEGYGAYTRELLDGMTRGALARGSITAADAARFAAGLERAAAEGEFYYGIVYHRVAGVATIDRSGE
ncbi:MAG TPA: methyltransferase domain-containing protein [Anaeromyxobacter sp.]|nr:methyltransferase domain-containing protein [Anaeromyxobacter sp.]